MAFGSLILRPSSASLVRGTGLLSGGQGLSGSGAGEERAQSWGCVPEVPALKWRLEVLYSNGAHGDHNNDPDGDGYTNLEEYLNQTDPHAAN